MLKRFVFASVVLAILCSITAAQATRRATSPDWHIFTSEAGEFSIDLPGTPIYKTQEKSEPGLTLTLHFYLLIANSNSYTVMYSELPPSEVSLNDRLEAGLARMIKHYAKDGVRETDRRNITSSFGCPGIEWVGALPQYPIVYMRIFATPKRAYILFFASNAPKETTRVPANRFFDSFKVTGQPCSDKPIEQPQLLTLHSKASPTKNPALPTTATLDLDPELYKGDIGSGAKPGSKMGGGNLDGNGGSIDYNKIFSPREVTRKAQILSKPAPTFTKEASKNEVTGVVRLRVILSALGEVTNIIPLRTLPDGLTENAIAAARQIKFIPAQKDGRNVSQYITVEYDFDIVYKEDGVTRKAVVTSKPQPESTEEARNNDIHGTVTLKAVLTRAGEVTGIDVIEGLPYGLTEKAIAAAREIKFEPAEKNGHPVSQYITLKYTF